MKGEEVRGIGKQRKSEMEAAGEEVSRVRFVRITSELQAMLVTFCFPTTRMISRLKSASMLIYIVVSSCLASLISLYADSSCCTLLHSLIVGQKKTKERHERAFKRALAIHWVIQNTLS